MALVLDINMNYSIIDAAGSADLPETQHDNLADETGNATLENTSTATRLHDQLLHRGQKLLQDLEAFQAQEVASKTSVDVSKFVREVKHELKLITKEDHRTSNCHGLNDASANARSEATPAIVQLDQIFPDSALHRLRSSNLSFYEKIWSVAQRQHHITAIRKLVAWRPLRLVTKDGQVTVTKSLRRDKKKVMVDIMCEGGRKWIKVWTRTQKNLILDMAKEGLVGIDSESEDDDGRSGISDDATNDLQLVKLARSLVQAAKTVRLDFRHPTVVIILPNVLEGEVPDVDKVLAAVREQGAIVQCANNTERRVVPSSTTSSVLQNSPQQAKAVNIDCTVLVALVSDISHCRKGDVSLPEHYQDITARDIQEQLDSEVDKPLLPNNLYLKLAGKQLICCTEAADHLRSIIRVMGSETEKRRAAILLGDEFGGNTRSRRATFAALSVHEVPIDLAIPVSLVEATSKSCIEKCSDGLCEAVMTQLTTKDWFSNLNQAVVFHGWLNDLHTMTINRAIARRVRKGIDDILDQLELEGRVSSIELPKFIAPRFVICGRQRSLLGSEKVN